MQAILNLEKKKKISFTHSKSIKTFIVKGKHEL